LGSYLETKEETGKSIHNLCLHLGLLNLPSSSKQLCWKHQQNYTQFSVVIFEKTNASGSAVYGLVKGRSLAGIAGSNFVGVMDVCLLRLSHVVG